MSVRCHDDWIGRLYDRFAERPALGKGPDREPKCLLFADLCRDSARTIVCVVGEERLSSK